METDATVIVAVFAGLASFISPCVLPLLPGYLSLMSGYSVQELSSGDVSMRRVAGRTGLFIAGFTAVFVALGASATFIGGFIFDERNSFQTIAGWLVILMGLFIAVTAVWNPNLLMPLMKDRRVEVRPSRLGNFAAPVMGAAFAFGWTPCLGPFLGATLALGANSETVGRGMLLLFFYSLGLAVPFLIAALGLAKAFTAFNRLKRYLTPITVVSGLLLAAFGVLLVTDQLVTLNAWFSDLLIRIGLDGLTEI
jgi:cytochrome c-type biogenesis protein